MFLPRLRAAAPRSFTATQSLFARAFAARAPRSGMDEGEQTIYDKLNEKFPGTQLDVKDVSGECLAKYK